MERISCFAPVAGYFGTVTKKIVRKLLNSSNICVTRRFVNAYYLLDNSALLNSRALIFEFLKVFIFCVVLLCMGFASSLGSVQAQTVIKGRVEGAEGRIIKASIVTDYITHTPLYLAQDSINKDGSFYLDFNITSIRCINLEIDYYSTYVYIAPGRMVDLEFLLYDYRLAERVNAFWESEMIPELNYVMHLSDSNYYIFEADSGYLAQMNRYRIARYEEAMGRINRSAIFRDYIENVPFSVDNEYLMEFIGYFFDNYFSKFSNKYLWNFLGRVDSSSVLVVLDNMLDTLGIDPFLKNEMLREYVFIKGMYQYVESLPVRWSKNSRILVRNKAILMLEALAKRTKFKDFSKIIKQILLNWSTPESFAPMIVRDFEGKEIKFGDFLSSLEGKYIYLGFVSANLLLCPDCMVETDVLMRISHHFKDSVQIILINVDDEFMTYYHDHRLKKHDTPYFHFNRQIALMRSLDAVHFPCYFILNPEGVVLESDFAKPSDDLAKKISSVLSRRQ
jgi:hypothetical protein